MNDSPARPPTAPSTATVPATAAKSAVRPGVQPVVAGPSRQAAAACQLPALPGVPPDRFEITLEEQAIVVFGERSFGAPAGPGAVLRLEIPYGRFRRRILLPFGSFRLADMLLENGCLKITLERLK